MKTAREYNDDVAKAMREYDAKKHLAGVACDECGTEMHYVGNETLLSYPPKRRIVCPVCGYRACKVKG